MHCRPKRMLWIVSCYCLLLVVPTQLSADEAGAESHTYQRGPLEITVGPVRTLMRGARSPLLTTFRNGSLLLTGGSRKAGSQTIRSLDHGKSWRHESTAVAHLNTLELADGKLLVVEYDPRPAPDRPGHFVVKRWESDDQGRSLRGPFEGTLELPIERFDPKLQQWFHGNLVQMPDGELLSLMQGEELAGERRVWRCYLVRTADGGKTWRFGAMLADWKQIGPLERDYALNGLRFHGAVEPFLLHAGGGHLIGVMRTVDDESNLPTSAFGTAGDSFEDLNNTVSGDGIYPGVAKLSKDRYYQPGPPSTPALIAHSYDGGNIWSAPAPMKQARGCFPHMAVTDGIVALTYGGLSALRWGNCLSMSTDGGAT